MGRTRRRRRERRKQATPEWALPEWLRRRGLVPVKLIEEADKAVLIVRQVGKRVDEAPTELSRQAQLPGMKADDGERADG